VRELECAWEGLGVYGASVASMHQGRLSRLLFKDSSSAHYGSL
jgi:hypothetical protein